MVNFCVVCGCCTRTDIVREHLEDTLRICDVSAMGLLIDNYLLHENVLLNKLPTQNDVMKQLQKCHVFFIHSKVLYGSIQVDMYRRMDRSVT
jgi:hypothetical protein